ncbi:Hypothetical predicted protein [Mytilus galloprovincialis]|uniref:UMOD/GP2/OIT3-like D8C domain-containing protein n=1 Tax=Mytilus galloprovincialis TaxID=29158 RepID=A0A8B6GK60_MYTGA|nr:Hypothetical predicted protein [Mytilus galloprovincialis]
MPKQKSRTRRKAAPQSIEEDVPNLVEEQSHQLRRRKTRRAVPETITEQPSVPTANDIADALFRKFESSGVQLVKDNTAVPINDLTGMLSSSSTQPENSSNNDSQGQMLAVFQPPLSSDPNINTSSDGELLNSNSYAENPYACDMLRHSIPLDYHVSSKVKSDVWCDNYVNFALLLPSNIDDTCNESTLFENLNITISNRKSNKELLSIHQWTNAFDIFMSIYLEKNLRSARALIKYGFNVRSLCKSLGFQAAKVYDEKFRKIRKILGLQWIKSMMNFGDLLLYMKDNLIFQVKIRSRMLKRLDTNFYKGHSFRIGAATSAAARGVPLALIQSMGDPCVSYKVLDTADAITRSVANANNSPSLCDNTLEAGWYRVTSYAGERMPTECIVGGMRCGTSSSIWMNGTYPDIGDVKTVQACAAHYDGDCCKHSYDIEVKNCTDYLVYNLSPVSSCYQAYCFGSELKCPDGQTSDNGGFTPGCEIDPCHRSNYGILIGELKRSSNYTLQDSDIAIEDSRLTTGWYRIDSVTGNDIVNGSVTIMHCGTVNPLWMNGSIPDVSHKTVDRKVCYSGLSNSCEKEFNIKVRNCGNYRIYYLIQLNVDKSAYCFDDENNKEDKPYIWVIVAILAVSSATLLTILFVKFILKRTAQKRSVSCISVQNTFPPS